MRVFRSKVDAFVVVATVLPVLVALGIVMIQTKGDTRVLVILIPILLIVALLPISTMRATDYRIDGDELRIRCGFLSWRVPIHSIRSIAPTRNMSSAPALSLDRLAIHYRIDGQQKTILVSPIDKRGFIDALRTVNPSIRG